MTEITFDVTIEAKFSSLTEWIKMRPSLLISKQE